MVTTDKVQAGETTTSTSTSTTASQWQTYNHYKAEQGWECPRCGRINAPWVRQCDCSRNDKWDITWDKHDYTKPWWYDYKVTCNGVPVQTQIDSDTFKVHPNSTIYSTVGGSDYWNPTTKEWTNVEVNTSNAQSNSTTYPPNCHTFNYSTPTKGD